MVDFLSEQRISLTQVAREEGVNVSTPWRWCLRGCKGVRLESFLVGGRRFTTREAFARFVAATTAAASGAPVAPQARTNRQRDAAIRRAEAELARAGV